MKYYSLSILRKELVGYYEIIQFIQKFLLERFDIELVYGLSFGQEE